MAEGGPAGLTDADVDATAQTVDTDHTAQPATPGSTDTSTDGSVVTSGPITASALPGTAFHGEGRAQADPDAVLDRARAALPGVAAHAGVQAVTPLTDGTYQVTRADGSQFNLRVASGPVADRAVAASAFDTGGTAVVTVSDRAADAVIERALAHEVAELAALGQPLAEGAAVVTPLTPADVAELVTAAHQVRTADTWSRAAARRELAAIVDRLGLRDGMLGAEQRVAALPAEARAALADATSQRSARTSERFRLRADRRAAEAESNGRPTGLPRMRTYLVTHFTVNSLLGALATKLTLDATGRPEVALMVGAGAFVGAIATGPAKWLAKRAGLAAEDRRARYDARQDARTAAETDTSTGAELAARTGDATSAVQELGEAVTGLGEQLAAVQEQLRQDERRHRLMGRPRRFPPVGGGPSAATGQDPGSGTPTSTDGRSGPPSVGLTPHQHGRLAELRSLVARHDGARPWARLGTGREIRALLDNLGLRQGTPGADQRRDLVPADVRPLVDRFGDSRTAAVRDRVRVVVDRYPADGQRPGKVAPWWMSVAETAPNLLTAATIAGVGDLLGQLKLGWFGIAGALAAAATGVAVDPVIARKEAAAKDARDTWDVEHPAVPAEALLSQAAEALADPISAVADRAATAVRRTADLEQRLADLERRLAESQRRNGLADSFRRLLLGDPAWAGLTPPNANIPAPRTSTDPATSTGPAAAPSADPRDTASLQRLAELAARHAAAGPLARPSVARQLRVLVDQLGLREGTPGADQRRELVPAELRPAVERHGRRSLTDRAARLLTRPPAHATDSAERPSNVPSIGVYAVEQTPGPLIQAGTTVGVAQALQVAAGAGPGSMLAGGLLGPLRDLLLKRVEARIKDARRAWDLANPNPATDPTSRVAGLAGPPATAVTDVAGQLDAASRRLDDMNAALDRLAQGRTTAPGTGSPGAAQESTGATTPGSTDPATTSDPATATGTQDPAATPDQDQEGTGPEPLSRADVWEMQTAAHHVRTADQVSLKPALRELHAVIDRLGLREGMLGAPDRMAQLPPEARQVVAEFGGDRAGRARQLRTLRAERRSAEDARPTGVPRLRTYLVSSVLTTAATAGAATAIAFAVASPLAPVIPIAAVAAAPVIGVAKWHAKRQGLAADDVRSRFDARSDARDAADRVDQVIDRLNEPVAELERAADRLEGRLSAAESATGRLAERLAESHRRTGLLSRLFGTVDSGRTDPTATNPERGTDPGAGPNPEGGGDAGNGTDSGRITAAAVPNSGFHGLGRPTADPAAVLDTARAALPRVAPYAGVDEVAAVGPDVFEVRAAGLYPLRVQLTVGPLADGVVAQSTRNPDGSFTVTVSDRAVDGVVARALAHEVAELVSLHESGQALVGPLDPGNVDGLIDPAGLTAHDRGRMAEIRLLAAEYEAGDPATRLAVRAEIDALVDHLGLRVGDPAAPARWAAMPRDAVAHLMRLSVPSVTPESVAQVLKGGPALSDVERFRMFDYRARLAPDFQVPSTTELDARLRELAVQGEQVQTSLPRMPAYAGQIIALPPAQLDLIRQVDPQLADRIAAQGVYVDLTGQFDLRPYAVDSQPEINLGDARPAFDLGTPAGRQALLVEDRVRARAALRGLTGGQPVPLLATHDFQYLGAGRVMGLVPDALTQVLRGFSPIAEATTAETTVTAAGPTETAVVADRVTLPAAEAGTPAVAYGQALDGQTGQPPPLFDGPPKREDVQQGMLGDCGMIAVIGAVAGHLPAALADLFHVNSDGTVDVLLYESSLPGRSVTPTGRRLRITVQPDVPLRPGVTGRTAYADQSAVGVAWASLLEKAIAAIDRTWTQERHDQWQQQWTNRPGVDATQAAPLGYARLNNGSSRLVQAELLTQLTGLPTSVDQLDTSPGQEAAAEALLAELLAAGSPVITGTRPASAYQTATLPHGLYAGHAYEVVGVANGQVQLRNPWNSSHPTPMPVRAFLDLMSPWYAHVELARTATTAVPNSSFDGVGRPAADAVAVVDAARAALPTVAGAARADQIVAVSPDRFEVRVAGLDPLSLRVAAGPLADGVVAQTVRNLDGSFTLTVSDRATDAAVTRALAHEVAELVALHESGQALVGQLDADRRDGPIDPAGLTAQDQGRLAELRILAASYADADPAVRLALRAEIDALVDHLGLRLGTPDAHARWGVLPGDVSTHLMQLSVPLVTPESITGVLNGTPSSAVERFRAIDYRARLAPDFQVPSAAAVDARLRELAVQGEQAQSSLPRMPACAGQIIAMPPAQLDLIRQADPQLAARIAAEGVYVDLTGRFDLRPYVLDGAPEFRLAESRAAFDPSTEVGRQSLLAEDRVRARVAFRAEYGANPAAMAVLNTHDFHYLTNARVLALVPDVLARALHALVPGAPPPDVEVEATVTAGETAVVADRVTLPAAEPGQPVPEYGQARDAQSGQPAPLLDGPPRREQVQQGMLGDCGMLATMAAVAGHRPDAIAGLFQPNPDGTVDVLLHESSLLGDAINPTGRRLRITVHPDVPLRPGSNGDTAYADQAANGSSWASLLEKALAAVDRTWSTERHERWQRDWRSWHSPNDPHVAAPTGYARLNVGSTPQMQAELLTQLTGTPSRAAQFDKRPGQEAAVEARLAALLAAGSPVITGTKPESHYPESIRKKLPHKLYAGHAYEVVAVGNGQVQLRNPWNSRHPTPMTVREFLDLMDQGFAHLEPQATPPVAPPAANVVPPPPPVPPVVPPPPPVPPVVPPPPPVPPAVPPPPPAKEYTSPGSRPHSLGRTYLEELAYAFVYYALLAADGTVNGLAVVESSERGQRSAHWTVGGAAPGPGGSLLVGRAEAERIARDVLGFGLPDEPTLHDMLDG